MHRYEQVFSVLLDDCPAKPFDVIKGIVEDELGCPVDAVFASLEETPLGAASIGQVHRATLKVVAPGGARARPLGAVAPGVSGCLLLLACCCCCCHVPVLDLSACACPRPVQRHQDGTKVVVKVQYPEVEKYFQLDMATIKVLISTFKCFDKDKDAYLEFMYGGGCCRDCPGAPTRSACTSGGIPRPASSARAMPLHVA